LTNYTSRFIFIKLINCFGHSANKEQLGCSANTGFAFGLQCCDANKERLGRSANTFIFLFFRSVNSPKIKKEAAASFFYSQNEGSNNFLRSAVKYLITKFVRLPCAPPGCRRGAHEKPNINEE
jgi:hypothetical protein